jgi:hypothetical protein
MISASSTSGEILSPPDEVVQLPSFATKRAMEFAHLQHFKRLIGSQLPHLNFRLIGDGLDPPDFVLSREHSHFGLELTVFATPERRERAAFFSKLHDRLLLAHVKGRLRGLSGIKVDVAFGDLGEKPFAINDDSFEQLVGSFCQLGKQKRSSRSRYAATEPVSAAEWPRGEAGSIRWYVSAYADTPFRGSKLSNATGFEVEYMHRQWVTTEDVARAINERVSAKDRAGQGVDELLIVAGGPDQAGRAFPAEAMLAYHFLEGRAAPIVRPVHIQRVFVDIWWLDRLYVVHGE